MQTIWRVHRASAQYTFVALEIHCFGVNIPSLDSGTDVCPEYLKKKPVPHFCCHHYFKLTIVFLCGARKRSVDKLVILERAANLQFLFSAET